MDFTNLGQGYFESAGLVPERTGTEDLGCYEWLLGNWEICYPDKEGLIREDYFERLELRPDLTYRWDPAPLWAKSSGSYGVTAWEEGLKLYFEQRRTTALRGNHLVPVEIPTPEGPVVLLNWQRMFNNAVVLSDRVFVARRPRRTAESTHGGASGGAT